MAEGRPVPRMFKVLIVGPVAVGKTAIINRYFDNTFSPNYNSSVGVDFKEKKIKRNDCEVSIQVWDTAGQERYKSITSTYYRGADGFFLVFDLTNRDSFRAVDIWVAEAREQTYDEVAIVMVGNKSDMAEQRVVSREDGQRKADSLDIKYVETSTKDGSNVKTAFGLLLDVMVTPRGELSATEETQGRHVAVDLEERSSQTKSLQKDGDGCYKC